MAFLLNSWPGAFLLTVVVELPVLLVVLRNITSVRRILSVGLTVNLLTHPVVWFLLPRLCTSRTGYLLTAEGFALSAEAALLWSLIRPCTASRALLAAVAANGTSYFVGLGLFVAVMGRIP